MTAPTEAQITHAASRAAELLLWERRQLLDIHGGSRGADTLAGAWAQVHGVFECIFPAQWEAHGKGAGPRRNQAMIDFGKPDLVVAFPGGAGTADMIMRARKAGVLVHEVEP